MTEPLYYDDTMEREFSALITWLSADRYVVKLDRTLFYPEGGGQPGDRGNISGIAVSNTTKDEHGDILHHLAEPLPDRLESNRPVDGLIDWQHRYDYMQQHTGQHVLSAALHRTTGASTVSVHQGAEVMTIELDTDEISHDRLRETVAEANRVIASDLPVRAFTVDHRDLPAYSLRRPTTRKGAVRLVEIEGYDLVACGGVHLPRTGLLNLAHLTGTETIRGHLRLAFKIGDRALRDYDDKHAACIAAADLFSCRTIQLPERVEALQQEVRDLHRMSRLRAERIAELMLSDAIGVESPERIILQEEDDDIFKALAERATGVPARRLVLLNRGADSAQWAIVIGEDHPFPQEAIRNRVLSPVAAKGGGKPPLWRGIIPTPHREDVARFVAAFLELWK